jgi:sulfur-carrier protein
LGSDAPPGPARPVLVRYYAGARAAAGVNEETVGAATVPELRRALAARHDPRFERVLGVSTLLCDGRPLTDTDEVAAGAVVEVLPPFAGG